MRAVCLSLSSSLRAITSVLTMPSQCCTACARHLPLTSFLKDALTDPTDPTARVYRLCISCRTQAANSKKRRTALRALDPNIPPPKRVRRQKTRLQAVPNRPSLLHSLLISYRTFCRTHCLLSYLLRARKHVYKLYLSAPPYSCSPLISYRTLCQTRSLRFNLLPARQMSALRLLPPLRPRSSRPDFSLPANGST